MYNSVHLLPRENKEGMVERKDFEIVSHLADSFIPNFSYHIRSQIFFISVLFITILCLNETVRLSVHKVYRLSVLLKDLILKERKMRLFYLGIYF